MPIYVGNYQNKALKVQNMYVGNYQNKALKVVKAYVGNYQGKALLFYSSADNSSLDANDLLDTASIMENQNNDN